MSLRHIAIVLILLSLGACEFGREGELNRLWRKTVKTDTVEAYLAFLAEQSPSEDVVTPKKNSYEDDFYYTRTSISRRRIFEIGLATARDTCPFGSLYLDLRQNIIDADGNANFVSWYDHVLKPLGVTFVDEPRKADATLVLKIEGHGVSQVYSEYGDRTSARRATTGGYVVGALWIEGSPETKVTFEGRAQLSDHIWTSGPGTGGTPTDVPNGIRRALGKAQLTSKFALLLYDACSPAAGAYLDFDDNIPAIEQSEPDVGLRTRMVSDYGVLRPMLLAATFGAASQSHIYNPSVEAFRVALNASGKEQDLVLRAYRNIWPNSWILKDMQALLPAKSDPE